MRGPWPLAVMPITNRLEDGHPAAAQRGPASGTVDRATVNQDGKFHSDRQRPWPITSHVAGWLARVFCPARSRAGGDVTGPARTLAGRPTNSR